MEILQLIIVVLSGGAAGAFITIIYNQRKDRIPPINFSIDYNTIFTAEHVYEKHQTSIILSEKSDDGEKNFQFDNLYLAIVKLKNTSRNDFGKFKFGLSLKEDQEIVKIDTVSSDEKHQIKTTPKIDFLKRHSQVDVRLTPFNRKDEYTIKILYTSSQNSPIEQRLIRLSTRHPVRLLSEKERNRTLSQYSTLFWMGLFLSLVGYSIFTTRGSTEARLEHLMRMKAISDSLKIEEGKTMLRNEIALDSLLLLLEELDSLKKQKK